MPNSNTKPDANVAAWVIAVEMGLGHLRAAHALRDIAADGKTVVYGEQSIADPAEAKVLRRTRRLYYLLSRALEIPFIGGWLFGLLNRLFLIPHYYPRRDLSKPTFGLRYMNYLIKYRGLGAGIVRLLSVRPLPSVHTFFATAHAADEIGRCQESTFLLVTDSDINRVWAPRDAATSRIRYLAPCANVARRLRSYGVPDERITLTGFPLPKENIGTREEMGTLKGDLFERLLRLDPENRFFSLHEREVRHFLGEHRLPERRPERLTVLFAVGGSGVQTAMARDIIFSLARLIDGGKVRLFLSAGINETVKKQFETYLAEAGVYDLDKSIRIIWSRDHDDYFVRFNKALRECDVLWTKPSELSFFCALGIPLVFSSAVGYHEKLNRRWVREMGAGFKMPGPARHCDEWLFDLRRKGRLAEAAWNGFLKGRKLGAYAVEDMVRTGAFIAGERPFGV